LSKKFEISLASQRFYLRFTVGRSIFVAME
jgi:hypothetical protein